MTDSKKEIPARERWVRENKEVLEKLQRGINDAAEGRTSSLGDFTQYTEDDSEE